MRSRIRGIESQNLNASSAEILALILAEDTVEATLGRASYKDWVDNAGPSSYSIHSDGVHQGVAHRISRMGLIADPLLLGPVPMKFWTTIGWGSQYHHSFYDIVPSESVSETLYASDSVSVVVRLLQYKYTDCISSYIEAIAPDWREGTWVSEVFVGFTRQMMDVRTLPPGVVLTEGEEILDYIYARKPWGRSAETRFNIIVAADNQCRNLHQIRAAMGGPQCRNFNIFDEVYRAVVPVTGYDLSVMKEADRAMIQQHPTYPGAFRVSFERGTFSVDQLRDVKRNGYGSGVWDNNLKSYGGSGWAGVGEDRFGYYQLDESSEYPDFSDFALELIFVEHSYPNW
jgi:hypothetical protein